MADDQDAPATPFQSLAQGRKWQQLLDEGRVTQEQFDRRAQASQGLALPERATPRQRTVGASRAPAESKFATAMKNSRRY